MSTAAKTVYLMRDLPTCGKSHTAKRLAGDNGVILKADEYFYSQVRNDPSQSDYSDDLLPAARDWNLARFREAVTSGVTPIAVDRGNGLNPETREYAAFAVEHGYTVELAEPDSPWWQDLRVLLKYRHVMKDELLDAWARKLADATRDNHRVPSSTIRRWMTHWKHDLTVDGILNSD